MQLWLAFSYSICTAPTSYIQSQQKQQSQHRNLHGRLSLPLHCYLLPRLRTVRLVVYISVLLAKTITERELIRA